MSLFKPMGITNKLENSYCELSTQFCLDGEFLGLMAVDGYKLKYLGLRTTSTDFIIKVPKEYRGEIVRTYTAGDRIQVRGIKTGEKLKAVNITKTESLIQSPRSPQTTNIPPKSSQLKILLCQKSDCCQKGAKEIYAGFQQELANRELSDRIILKSTGCLKQCKQAPNIILQPENSKLGRVKISQITEIVDKLEKKLSK